MAISSSYIFTLFTIFLFINKLVITNSQPVLNSVEQDSVYRVLNSLNSAIPWKTLFPDDLCSSAPNGIVCGYATLPTESDPGTVNILELNFGYVSDHNPYPPCNPNSIFDPLILHSFPYLRKLFFYNCFTHQPISLQPVLEAGSALENLEELVFIQNPSLYGSLTESLTNMTNLRRLIITGSNVSGEIPDGFGLLNNLEEVTLSGNKFAGRLPENVSRLKKLKILDVSRNMFEGNIPANIGELENLLKLDLSENMFSGGFPVSMKGLKSLELLDLSCNKFMNCGIPLFFGEMRELKGVFLSGNELGGVIPDIWGKLRGVKWIGLSRVGLVGELPSSIGVYLSNLSYLALDNNKLIGRVPMEFERLGMLSELNLKNNSLSGRLPFSAKFVSRVGRKLGVQGNNELCLDERVFGSFSKINSDLGQLKVCHRVEIPKSVLPHVSSSRSIGYQVPSLLVVFIWFFFV